MMNFPTPEEAQRPADGHPRDGSPFFEPLEDGFSWVDDPVFERWPCPH